MCIIVRYLCYNTLMRGLRPRPHRSPAAPSGCRSFQLSFFKCLLMLWRCCIMDAIITQGLNQHNKIMCIFSAENLYQAFGRNRVRSAFRRFSASTRRRFARVGGSSPQCRGTLLAILRNCASVASRQEISKKRSADFGRRAESCASAASLLLRVAWKAPHNNNNNNNNNNKKKKKKNASNRMQTHKTYK